MPLYQALFPNEQHTEAEREHPGVQLDLRRRFRRTMTWAMVGLLPTVILISATLWNVSSRPQLIVMSVLILVAGSTHLTHIRQPPEHDWVRLASKTQLLGGVAWAAAPWLAMPASPAWQMWLAALMLGALASNAIFGAQFASTFYTFQVPCTVISAAAFFFPGNGLNVGGGVLVLYAGLFSAGLAHLTRASAVDGAVNAVRNSELAAGLSAEQERLHIANALLDTQARTDSLTGLANRLTMTEALEHALSADITVSPVTLASLDLDGFKQVNDTFGHSVGDLLLVALGERLTSVAQPGELVTRHGGDELMVLSQSAPGEATTAFGQRLLSAFEHPFVIGDRRLDIGASIGMINATEDMVSDDLIRFVDAALYRSKDKHGSSVVVFDETMRKELTDKSLLEKELLSAFRAGELVPYIQPIVDLNTREIIGGEALIRWEHASGVRTAEAFISQIGELGLLPELNRQVLTAIHDFRLRAQKLGHRDLVMSVNIGPREFEHAVNEFSDSPVLRSVVVEITEGDEFPDLEQAKAMVRQLRAAGAQVYLDDFGVGFSSLAIAAQLDIDGVKLDRQFVQSMEQSTGAGAVVDAVVAMADRLGVQIIAEGIETPAQLELLRGLGITQGQGYLFAKALPMSDVVELLANPAPFSVGA